MLTTLTTEDEIIKMAKQAGFNLEFDDYVYEHWNSFQAFAKLVAEAEREACAKVVEPSAEHRANPSYYIAEEQGIELLDGIAAKIRARGEPTSRGGEAT